MNSRGPLYLVFVALNSERKEFVDVNIRLSGAPEDTAETNSLLLEDFRNIFLNVFKTPQDQLDGDIRRLRDGYGFTINFCVELDSIRKSGLLSPSHAR